MIPFFTYQDDIPEGKGYSIFSATHFGCLAAVGVIMAVIAVIYIRSGEKARNRILKGIPIFLLCMEASKWIVLFSLHKANIGMLPLHLCGLAVYDFLLASFLPSEKARSFFGEVAVILLGPGSVFALLLPDWTFYPVWNYFNIYGYLWHELLLLYPLLLLIGRRVKPGIRHLWYEIVFLAVIVPPIYIFDKKFSCNYLFINWPEPDTPLSWLASFMGNPGYLAGYAAMTIAVMAIIYVPFEIIRKIHRS
ncbi:MAG: TIGR02206 family membrane protein [Candidatus Weimeria sp.]